MERLLEQEFLEIVADYGSEPDVKDNKLNFTVIGSPLRQSRFLIVGDMWDVSGEVESQMQMPLVNYILSNPLNKTHRGYINFFNVMFNGNTVKTLDFLNKSVYTKGNWIRTPHLGREHAKELGIGRKLSETYLKAIIELVQPEAIICFGNSEFSATSAVFKALGENHNFWEVENRYYEPTNNNWSTYKFTIYHGADAYNVFSFPNGGKFHIWNANIEENEVFRELKSTIESGKLSAMY